MLPRLGIALVIIAIGVCAYTVGTRWQVTRITRHQHRSSVLTRLKKNTPAVIYFWSETCAPCKTVQSPALAQLADRLGPAGVQVIAINALKEPHIADEWGVLGLPTTFIIDRAGHPRHVNHGVIRTDQLERQIASCG
jgi:thioredoxin-like negative regulator of GroEL